MMGFLDWDSLISALVGGGFALLGAVLTMRVSKRERRKQDSRELVPLFYFLNSKSSLMIKLQDHTEAVPITKIVSEDEVADVRRRFSYAARALTLSEIGDINSFCNQLVVLEGARKDCYEATGERYRQNIRAYQKVLSQCIEMVVGKDDAKGIYRIGEKIEEFFSKELPETYR